MQPHSHTFEAIGTQWEITTLKKMSETLLANLHERIETFDRTYSRFRSDSLVHQIAQTAGTYDFPEDAKPLFDFYENLYDVTAGKVTHLIGDVLERAGYDASYSFQPHDQVIVPEWGDAVTRSGTTLNVNRPLTLDFGAAGKGYLVDIISALLDQASIKDYVVDASGDLIHRGKIDNRVGLENPLDTTRVIGIVDVKNESLCASASNRRTWGNGLHHIIDPSTTEPIREVIASWVIASSTMIADGIATAIFFVEPHTLAKKYNFQYVRMHADGSVDYSKNFKGEIF
jgi:thiamine biosynthesis lipoprotein